MSFTTDMIRNVSIAGHGGTGKTSLFENILFFSGVIPKAERVDSGKSVSDFTPEEIEKKMSIHSALSRLEWGKAKLNLVDTPGASDFVGEVVSAFRSTETAVMMVCGAASVQIETIKLWRRLDNRGMPRIVFVNKMDKERSDFAKVIDDLKDQFPDANFVPLAIPIGAADSYEGVVDLVKGKYLAVPGANTKEEYTQPSEEQNQLLEEYRTALVEAAAEGDDDLMEKYFSEGILTDEELLRGISASFKANNFVPVLCGAGESGSGILPLLELIANGAPSPLGFAEKAADLQGAPLAVTIDPDTPPSLMVYKTSIDQFSGRLSYFKAMSGTIRSDTELLIGTTGKKVKVGKLHSCVGKKLQEEGEIVAGDMGIISKMDALSTNISLSSPERALQYLPLSLPSPVHSVAISATVKRDEDKLNSYLNRASEEDLTFGVRYNPETRQTVVSAMGELHLNIILDTIRDRQKIDIETTIPRIAYRETISKSAEAEYTHKKQSGGHGQYGRVVIEIHPLARGEKMTFENAIRGGSISKGYMPGIEKGFVEGMEEGFLAGYPLVDIGFKVVDGKEHSVDSSEMAFKLAAKGALKAAVEKAKPVLLEPVMKLRVFTEESHVGDILSDLSARRGRVLGQESLGGGISEIDAMVPQSEMLRYSIDLRSITSGTASFETEFDHYNPISGKIAEEVIAASQKSE